MTSGAVSVETGTCSLLYPQPARPGTPWKNLALRHCEMNWNDAAAVDEIPFESWITAEGAGLSTFQEADEG